MDSFEGKCDRWLHDNPFSRKDEVGIFLRGSRKAQTQKHTRHRVTKGMRPLHHCMIFGWKSWPLDTWCGHMSIQPSVERISTCSHARFRGSGIRGGGSVLEHQKGRGHWIFNAMTSRMPLMSERKKETTLHSLRF